MSNDGARDPFDVDRRLESGDVLSRLGDCSHDADRTPGPQLRRHDDDQRGSLGHLLAWIAM
jgi:hypothetical protein